MKDIPDITFRKRTDPQLEFEIFSFRSLFRKQPRLPHPINRPHRLHFL